MAPVDTVLSVADTEEQAVQAVLPTAGLKRPWLQGVQEVVLEPPLPGEHMQSVCDEPKHSTTRVRCWEALRVRWNRDQGAERALTNWLWSLGIGPLVTELAGHGRHDRLCVLAVYVS